MLNDLFSLQGRVALMTGGSRDHGDDVARQVPVGRIGHDDDMAGAAIFLALRAGDYVVGATLTVDGGVAFGRAGIDGTRSQAE